MKTYQHLIVLACLGGGMLACGSDELDEIRSCTPPEEVRLDCDLSPTNFSMTISSQEDVDALCQQDCGYASGVLVDTRGMRVFEGPDVLQEVEMLTIGVSRFELEEIRGFNGLQRLDNLEIGSRGADAKLHTVEGFEGLVQMRTYFIEGMTSLEQVPIPENLRILGDPDAPVEPPVYTAGGLFMNRLAVENLKSLSQLEHLSAIDFQNNAELRTLEGLEDFELIRAIAIFNSPKLHTLEHLSSLRRIHFLSLRDLPNIRYCEVDALLEQLDEPPERLSLNGLSNAPCDD